MHIHIRAIEASIYGAVLAALLGFSGSALAYHQHQDEADAIAAYNQHLENKSVYTTTYPEPNAEQAAVIKNLEQRINCLERTQIPCAGKEIVRQANPPGTRATPTTPPDGT